MGYHVILCIFAVNLIRHVIKLNMSDVFHNSLYIKSTLQAKFANKFVAKGFVLLLKISDTS